MQTSSAASRVQASVEELFKGKITAGDAYVKFQLTSDITALLSMDRVEESSILEAEQITPLPSMPESVIGITSLRDRVFCVFDLAKLLSLPSSINNPRKYQMIVLQTTGETPIYFGLAIASLLGIVRFPIQKIQSSSEILPSKIAPFVYGVIEHLGTMNLILDFNQILEALTTLS